MSAVDVIVAGAGPVGLVAANVLADAGVNVVLLEADTKVPTNLRASTFQPSTLDMLDRFEVTAPLMAMGVKSPLMQYRDRQGWVAQFDFGVLADDCRHPYRVQCEQFRLCQLLAERLQSLPNARILFGTEALEVVANHAGGANSGVSVKVNENGIAGELQARWLICADGGKSVLRKSIGIELEGFTWPERFLVASTDFDFTRVMPDLSTVSYFADPQEWYFLLKVPGMWRVMFPVGEQEQDEDILSDAGIDRRLQRVHAKGTPYELKHRTIYAVHQRVAPTYRNGAAFIAGDAAHLNNPLGGMGMNGGIHDGFAIAERLAGVICGKLPATCLDDYERERRPVALEYVNKITIANKRNLEAKDPAQYSQWQRAMDRTAADPALCREYLLKVSMIESLRNARASVQS